MFVVGLWLCRIKRLRLDDSYVVYQYSSVDGEKGRHTAQANRSQNLLDPISPLLPPSTFHPQLVADGIHQISLGTNNRDRYSMSVPTWM